ncbi:universal stress protein [Nocardioides sp. GCM10027113]|uniref:universal stress protein n=1 Tax=unclassified Nocardioides TaxID=2615069 RepID=UPI00360D8435
MSEILVGVDRSEHSRRAVEFATLRAQQLHRSVVIVHVIPWSPYSFNTPDENEHRHERREAELKAATEQIIEPLAALARETGVDVDTVVRHGDPVDTLIAMVQERGSEHIVLGRTGDSRMRRAFFGSLPSQMVLHAPVPVTVVP